jgi:hypothetical protein
MDILNVPARMETINLTFYSEFKTYNKDFRESRLLSFSQIIILEIVQTVEIITSQLYKLQNVFE